jgi:hypothetical protein
VPDRLTRVLCSALLALTTGCATVAPSADRAASAAPARQLDAEGLRAAAVGASEAGPGWTVTVMDPGHSTAPERETADVTACQPVLDALSPADTAAAPTAETDLSATRAADPKAAVYAALLAFPQGRAERLRTELDALLARCGSFTAVPATRKSEQTRHRLSRLDTPTPEGADAATAFTLTTESGTAALEQHALVTRVGTVLAVFSTVGSGKEAAPEPDPQVVRAQLAKLRAALQN